MALQPPSQDGIGASRSMPQRDLQKSSQVGLASSGSMPQRGNSSASQGGHDGLDLLGAVGGTPSPSRQRHEVVISDDLHLIGAVGGTPSPTNSSAEGKGLRQPFPVIDVRCGDVKGNF